MCSKLFNVPKKCLLLCCFADLTPLDVPEILQNRVDRGSITVPTDPTDVIALVKQYMGSDTLAQAPLLVLTPGRAARVGMVPVGKRHEQIFKSIRNTLFVNLSSPPSPYM